MARSKSKKSRPLASPRKNESWESLSPGVWLPIVALILLPVIINPWGFNRFALPKLAFLKLVLIIFVIKMLVDLAKGRAVSITMGKWVIPYSVFLIVALISAIFSIYPINSFFGQTNRYDGLTTLLSYGLFAMVVASSIRNVEDSKAVHWGLLMGLLLVSFYAVLQHFGIGKSEWYAPSDIGRVFSTIGNSNLLGAYIALLLPALISFLIAPGLKKSDFVWVAWIALPLVVAALIFSATRGAWVGSFFGLTVFAVLLFQKRDILLLSKKVFAVFLAIVVLASLVALVAKPPSNRVVKSYVDRAKSIFSGGSSAKYRFDMWKITMTMISQRPFLGSGPDTFKENFFHYRFPRFDRDVPADKAHNDTLQIASTIGLLGLAAFLWFLLYLFLSGYKSFRSLLDGDSAVIVAAYISGMISYLISIQFSFSLPTVAPVFMGVVGATTAICGISKSPSFPQVGDGSTVPRQYARAAERRPYILCQGIQGDFKISPGKNKVKYVYFGIFITFVIFIFTIRGVVADRYVDASMIYFASGDSKAALQDIEVATRINSTEDSYYNIWAKMLLQVSQKSKSKKNIEKAIELYKKSKALNPNDEETYFGLNAAYYLAYSKFHEDVREEALNNVEELLQIVPQSSKANEFYEAWSAAKN